MDPQLRKELEKRMREASSCAVCQKRPIGRSTFMKALGLCAQCYGVDQIKEDRRKVLGLYETHATGAPSGNGKRKSAAAGASCASCGTRAVPNGTNSWARVLQRLGLCSTCYSDKKIRAKFRNGNGHTPRAKPAKEAKPQASVEVTTPATNAIVKASPAPIAARAISKDLPATSRSAQAFATFLQTVTEELRDQVREEIAHALVSAAEHFQRAG